MKLPRALAGRQGAKRQVLLCLLTAGCGFILALWFGLPLHPLVSQVEIFAARQNLELEISSPGRAFPFGLQAATVSIGHRQLPREPVQLSQVDIRPLWTSLLGSNPGLAISAQLFDGEVTLETHRQGESHLELSQLQLRESLAPQLPIEVTGVLTEGSFSGRLPLSGQNQGQLQLELADVSLLGMKKLGGSEDRLSLGKLQIQAESRGAALQVRLLEARGGAIELAGSGSLNLGRTPASSRLTLSLILKPTQGLEPGFRELLNLLGKPGRDGAYRFRLSGPLNAVQLR